MYYYMYNKNTKDPTNWADKELETKFKILILLHLNWIRIIVKLKGKNYAKYTAKYLNYLHGNVNDPLGIDWVENCTT